MWKTLGMFAVVSVMMVGCATEPDEECTSPDSCAQSCTTDADCTNGQRCEAATGLCVAKAVDRALSCAKNTDCLAQEICHPEAKVCVKTCSSAGDCPDTAKTCAPMSATDSTRVCQCSTSALCNQGRQVANLVCSDLDNVCAPKCIADADCGGGRQCNTASGQCEKVSTLTCSIDADCLEGEICHPTSKVCVQTCTGGVDCPSSAKTCAPVSATDSRQVCQCSTNALCNIDRTTPDLVCGNLDHVCTAKCTKDTDCSTGRTCDTATGQCKGGSSGGGGAGAACSGEGQSSCIYGTYFCSAAQCTALPVSSCTNYTNFQSKSQLGTAGRILYGARVVSATTDATYCGSTLPKRVRIALSAYASTPFPQSKEELSDFLAVKTDGSVVPGTDLVSLAAGNYTVSGTNRERAEIIVSHCVDSSSTTYSAAYYFTNGNFFCYQANYL